MARPRKWGSDAERQAAFKARARADGNETRDPVTKPSNETKSGNETRQGLGRVVDDAAMVDGIRVPLSLFDGYGRAVPRRHNGRDYVLIAAGNGAHMVATYDRWRDHMSHACQTVSPHTGEPFTLRGWQCTSHA